MVSNRQFQTYLKRLANNATTLRTEIIRRMLNPGKDINFSCGYPDTISKQDYKAIYEREGLAARVVSVWPDESWSMIPEVFETEKPDETEFEKRWDDLLDSVEIYHYLHRIDVLSGIGRYGILLLGLDDGKDLNEPVEGVNDKTGEKVGNVTDRKLLYLRPFDENVVEIKNLEQDPSSPRFGFPVEYQITIEDVQAGQSNSRTLDVHWTRVIHVVDNREVNEIFGRPRMQNVYNRLLDVRKILSGSGEMFWKGAFPGYVFEVNPELAKTGATIDSDSIKAEFQSYSNDLQRYLAITGVTAKSLAPQVTSPEDHLRAELQYIALSLGIPLRIWLGTEEGKLAGGQDAKAWRGRVKKRQNDYLSPLVIRNFIDRLIVIGVLPEPKEYTVVWPDLNTPSDEEKAKVALVKTESLAKYIQGDVASIIPPKEYLMEIQGMELEQAEAIEKAANDFVDDRDAEAEKDLAAREEDVTTRESIGQRRRRQELEADTE